MHMTTQGLTPPTPCQSLVPCKPPCLYAHPGGRSRRSDSLMCTVQGCCPRCLSRQHRRLVAETASILGFVQLYYCVVATSGI